MASQDPGTTEGPGVIPPVFLVEALPDGEHAVLDGEEARHAVTVRRTRVGAELVLSDGAGELARGVVRDVTPGRAPTLTLEVRRRWFVPESAPHVTVVQALVKGDRGELAVELATEAGADAIVPWQAARCVARWEDGPRTTKALARWRSAARSAAKQARRARIPEVREPVRTPELAESLRSDVTALVLDAEATNPLAELTLPTDGELLVITGPEGGIAAEELARLRDAGATPVRLGPTVLRASTAAAVTLGALGVLTDRWK